MNKTIKVARFEYLHHVGKKRFWITLISAPLGMVLIFVVTILFTYVTIDKSPVGFIDQAGLISQVKDPDYKPGFLEIVIDMVPYTDEETARADVENKTLQGFFVIPAGYESTYQIDFYSNKMPSSDITQEVERFLTMNLRLGDNIPHLERIEAGSQVNLRSLDGSQQSDGTGWHRVFVPIIVGLVYFALIMSSGGYLLQSLVEEKQNRTMEIMITSVTPNQLMVGKTIGNISVGLTQIGFWALVAVIALFVMRDRFPLLNDLNLSVGYVAISLGMMILSFIVNAGIMATIGATMTTVEEGQSVTGLIVVPMMLPFYFMQTYFINPNGTLPKVLSYIPVSAPLSMSLRMAFTNIPTWEIILVFAILIVSAVLVLWLSGKAFSLGMLEYSKRIRIKDLFRKEVSNG